MPVNIPDGYFQVSVIANVDGAAGQVINVFGVRDTTDQGAQACADSVESHWMDDFGDFFSTIYHCERIHVSSEPPGPVADKFSGDDGTVSGDPAPLNVAALAKKVTGFSGKRNRGRIYFGAVPLTYVDNQDLSSAGVTQLQAGCDALRLGLEADDFPMVILHSNNAVPSLVTDLIVESRLATQRGRLRD